MICIDSNRAIHAALETTDAFDVIITDVYRDGIGGQPDQPKAGLETVQTLQAEAPGVPVIVYSGHYLTASGNKQISSSIIATTNNTKKVFEIVTEIARKKMKIPI